MRFGPFDPAKFPPRLATRPARPPRPHRPTPTPRLEYVEVQATYVGEPTTGLWCGACALPSGWACDVEVRLAASPSTVGQGTIVACTDCGTAILTQRGAQ